MPQIFVDQKKITIHYIGYILNVNMYTRNGFRVITMFSAKTKQKLLSLTKPNTSVKTIKHMFSG